MSPAAADQTLTGRMGLAPDVRLVTAPDGQRSGLQRGIGVIEERREDPAFDSRIERIERELMSC